ncbi:MAG TPA: hypothetical protein P5056_03335, partial [Candidatus Paceibacterota bacterium]|nr:hypothetical protein [Candidatus Paceibacterota bacterium]
MNYLPSKKFAQKVLAISLVALGWFYVFGIKNNNSNQNSTEDSGGIMTFFRTSNSSSPDMKEMGSWGDLSQEEVAAMNGKLA